MALSTGSRTKIDRAWGHYIQADGVNLNDMNAMKECLYDHWDVITSNSSTIAYVATQDTSERAAINTKQKAELEAEGYTVTGP